ncbi:MFS transporter [Streptomyces sp. SID486]|uniref:MFS transporter n=1 Tax=Streptomyces sp. SID486 TaxID=2690264 RepID=UPI001371FA01|nr:MFS transporter [Streptomyces sp. SID486]MYY00409.1 MFS transporter [Streptomyces sp. SID486]
MTFPLFALMLCVFGVGTSEYVIAGILPGLSDDLGIDIPSAGLLVTAYALGVVIGGPLVTIATVRIQRKTLMLVLMAVFIAGNVLAAVAPSYGVIVVARVLAALVHSTFVAVGIMLAVNMVPEGQAGTAVAKVSLGLNLATVLGVPLGTFIGESYGWRATFWAVAGITTLATLLVAAVVRPAEATGGGAASELKVLTNRRVQIAIVMTVLGSAGFGTVFTYISPLLTDVTHFSTDAVALLLIVFGVGSVLGTVLGGKLADRSLMPALCGLLAALTVILLLFGAAAPVQVIAAVLVFVFGAASFSIIPGLQARILSAATGAPTLALAVNISAFQLANAGGSWLGGRVVDGAGVRWITVAGAAVTVLGLALGLFELVRDRRAEQAGQPERAAAGEPDTRTATVN